MSSRTSCVGTRLVIGYRHLLPGPITSACTWIRVLKLPGPDIIACPGYQFHAHPSQWMIGAQRPLSARYLSRLALIPTSNVNDAKRGTGWRSTPTPRRGPNAHREYFRPCAQRTRPLSRKSQKQRRSPGQPSATSSLIWSTTESSHSVQRARGQAGPQHSTVSLPSTVSSSPSISSGTSCPPPLSPWPATSSMPLSFR